jgi:hypothetical protein
MNQSTTAPQHQDSQTWMPLPSVLHRKCGCGQHTIAGGVCTGCSKERETSLQRSAVNNTSDHGPGVPPIVHQVLNSSGQSLDADTRAFMEPRFGHDFSHVRVHTDSRAAESARAVNARAYTVGRDLVFGSGQYAPTTNEGQSLLAHELAHVVQHGRSAPAPAESISSPTDAAEQNADTVSEQVMAGGVARQPIATARQSTLHRLPFGIRLPTGLRGLDPVEETIARGVYGSSLIYGRIFLSNALGGGGRPFTLYVPSPIPGISGGTVINIGPSAYATPGSNPSLLIHELAHSWQSQHHPNPAWYMANSIASQAAAGAAGGSAYCYIPGKWFGLYGAEQIAQQVENGEAPIISHVAAASPGGTDWANVAGLGAPHWETPGGPGVRC